jgi:hypothetical protein
MVAFIDAHRAEYGVEPICAQLPIAPSTYFERKARERDPSRLPARVQRDRELCPAIERGWHETGRLGGAKVSGDAAESTLGGRFQPTSRPGPGSCSSPS